MLLIRSDLVDLLPRWTDKFCRWKLATATGDGQKICVSCCRLDVVCIFASRPERISSVKSRPWCCRQSLTTFDGFCQLDDRESIGHFLRLSQRGYCQPSCIFHYDSTTILCLKNVTLFAFTIPSSDVGRFLPRELCSARCMPWSCICLSVCPSVTSRSSTKMAKHTGTCKQRRTI